jgi:hypothetical protein
LASAIQQTLSTAFPQARINMAISPNLKSGYQDSGVYESLGQFGTYVNQLSKSILGTKGYGGIHITPHNGEINVWDGTTSVGVIAAIQGYELIGQPTWVDKNIISAKVVLRSDLRLGTIITLPPGAVLLFGTSASSWPSASEQRTQLTFSGAFQVLKLLHIGDFRNPDGAQWSTNIEASIIGTGGDPQADAAALATAVNAQMNPTQLPREQMSPNAAPTLGLSAGLTAPSLMRRSVRRY